MTHCEECGKPWGVMLDRKELPTPEKLELARAELIEMLWELWECEYEPDELARIDKTRLPKVYATHAVYVTEALSRFVEEHGLGEIPYEECWIEEQWANIPGWLLKGRRHRWALRWDCCDIGHAENYMAILDEANPR